MIGGIAILVGLVFFLHPSIGDEKQTIYVRLSDINKINVGTRVLFAGKPVGEVSAVTEIYHARETQPTDELGRIYFYQLTLKIDSGVHVYSTDEITLQTSGLLGEKSIAIIPKSPPKGVVPQMITDKTPFYADSVDPIENTFSKLSDLGTTLNSSLSTFTNWFDLNKENLSHAICSFGNAMSEITTATHTVNEENVIPEIKKGAEKFTSAITKVDDALTLLNQEGVFTNAGTVMTNLSSITQEIADGQGTLGKLIKNDDMYLRLTAIMSKADTMMNDINHYGILFHLNKAWQRSRTKRMTVMNAVDTPVAFKNYFQTEVDQINTAMARISMLVEKAQVDGSKKVLESPKFRENFAELLRQVDEMSDNLKLYNEQLSEALNN